MTMVVGWGRLGWGMSSVGEDFFFFFFILFVFFLLSIVYNCFVIYFFILRRYRILVVKIFYLFKYRLNLSFYVSLTVKMNRITSFSKLWKCQ